MIREFICGKRGQAGSIGVTEEYICLQVMAVALLLPLFSYVYRRVGFRGKWAGLA